MYVCVYIYIYIYIYIIDYGEIVRKTGAHILDMAASVERQL